jgi:hypothetical protein
MIAVHLKLQSPLLTTAATACTETGMFAVSSLAENAAGELFLVKYEDTPTMIYQLPCPGCTINSTTTAASAVPRLPTTPG